MRSSNALAVHVQAVSYRYPQSDKGALSDISCTFPTGTTAIVGPNGAGKSTLVKLLTGLLAPTSGSISVELPDGKRLLPKQADKAVLFQEPSHLHLSIRQNVTMRFKRTPGEDSRIHDALELAGLSGVVERLPDGIDTLVGAGFGGQLDLSGGQWQRLALARLIYQDSPVMILDEPVASLDPDGERAVFELFAQMSEAKVILFTTHRYDSIPEGTTIVVLVDGRIAEIGTHEQLLRRQRHYWSLLRYGPGHGPQHRAAHNGRLHSTPHTDRLRRNTGPGGPERGWTGDGPANTGGEDPGIRQRWDADVREPASAIASPDGDRGGLSPKERRSADLELVRDQRQAAARRAQHDSVTPVGDPVFDRCEVGETAPPGAARRLEMPDTIVEVTPCDNGYALTVARRRKETTSSRFESLLTSQAADRRTGTTRDGDMYADAVAGITESIFPIFYVQPESDVVGVCGTGFFVDDSGLFLTSEHVMAAPPTGSTMYFYGKTPDEVCEPAVEIERVASDPSRDLYLGRVARDYLASVKLSSEPVRPGDSVCLSGYPLAVLDVSPRGGLVGNVRRYWQPTFVIDVAQAVIDGRTYDGYIAQHSCFPGMSGGPVFDMEGNVRGMAAATFTRTIPPVPGGAPTVVANAVVIDVDRIRAFLAASGAWPSASAEAVHHGN